ncbi:reverse transcriptase domain-containing protein [Phascolarctobacterium succinatutens]|uniref:reverse transcriptase domain-containing protein n=1 Tax=Phascolarctobacterium succinatutens TaxID=626940 RepID=UPI00350E367F
MDKEEIISFERLCESMLKCKCNVIWKPSVSSYYLNGIERNLQLSQQLADGTYRPRAPRLIKITYPKKRDGLSIAFRDRVYQRSLNDNEVYPMLTKSFIYDNCACQRGKGTDFARKRLKRHLWKFYTRHGNSGYVLQIDIKGYYPNMRHDVVKKTFREHLPKETYEMSAKILDEQYVGDVGYNPGSQMVQIAGISVLDKLDHYIKERLHAKYYLRYMDDFLIIYHDKNVLKAWLEIIKERLALIGFRVSEKKTTIKSIRTGFDFLGFTYRVTSTGKIIMIAKSERVKHERYMLRKMAKLVARGRMTVAKYEECYASWRNHINKGNSFKLLVKMDKYKKEVLEYETRKNHDQRPRRARTCKPRSRD